MKLIIEKDQAKKMMGGVSFTFNARVELNEEEKALIARYKAGKMLLHQKSALDKVPGAVALGTGGVGGFLARRVLDKIFSDITIERLVNGVDFKCKDIAEILDHEEQIKSVVAIFYNYLQTMKEFGGTQEYNLPEDFEAMAS